jgi:hypothetical protein
MSFFLLLVGGDLWKLVRLRGSGQDRQDQACSNTAHGSLIPVYIRLFHGCVGVIN